jgi:hypothetical protein
LNNAASVGDMIDRPPGASKLGNDTHERIIGGTNNPFGGDHDVSLLRNDELSK